MHAKQLADLLVRIAGKAEGKKLEAALKAYVEFLASRNELHRLPSIERELDRAWTRARGFSKLRVETAHPLSAAATERIEKIAAGADVEIAVMPELIAGMRVRTGSRLVDATALGSLERLRTRLAASIT